MSDREQEPDWDDAPLDELAAELRESVGDEFRAEAEEVERETAKGILRRRTLAAVASELMQRGDRVTVGTSGRSFTGHFVFTAGDLASLRTPSGDVEVNLAGPVFLHVAERAMRGGVAPGRGSGSFRARLKEFEQTGEPLEVVAPAAGQSLFGRITVVARDHVVLVDRDEREWFLPVAAVAFVVREAPSR